MRQTHGQTLRLRARLLGMAVILPLLLGGCGGEREETGQRGPRPSTIVLLTLDTLRRDAVGAYAPKGTKPSGHTPHLDAFARRAIRFSEARTVVPLTLPAHAAMLTGLPPVTTGCRVNTAAPLPAPDARGFPLVAERLRASGWHTAAFVSAGTLDSERGLDAGFETYDDGDLHDPARPDVGERPGAETVRRALAWLAAHPPRERVFLWVHVFDAHAPYTADGTYGGDVELADAAAGALLAAVARRDDAHTAVLVVGDHGEGLGELGEREHGLLLADGVLRVPLMLRAPGCEPAVRADPVSVCDVAPTLAALAGVDWPAARGVAVGRDLLGAPDPHRVLLAESVYGHHLHRWAQLVGAADRRGTVVDAGRGRVHLVARARYGVDIDRVVPAPQDAWAARLLAAIADYKRAERSDRLAAGPLSPYGGQGVVSPFLSPEQNAARPDPYASIARHDEVVRIRRILLGPPEAGPRVLEEVLRSARAMDRPDLDARSPELQFWIGEAAYQLGLHRKGEAAATLRAEAERHFLRAFELGYKDAVTLVRACGVNAAGREAECLRRFDALAPQVPALDQDARKLRSRLRAAVER